MSAGTRPAVLVVEDERLVARDLQQTLEGLGYDAFGVAASVDEALARANERRPDAVLLDIRIQGLCDGIEVGEVLRMHFDPALVYVTAHAEQSTVERAKRTEPHGYLLKPVRSSELRSTLEIALHRHEAEKRLRERENWFSTTLRSMADGVIAVGADAHVAFLNPVAEELTGWSSSEAVGRPLEQVLRLFGERTRMPVESAVLRALRSKTRVETSENVVLLGRDAEVLIEDSAAPIIDESGRILGAVLVLRDVGEKRRLQASAMFSDRMASVGLLAAGVGHEINNPLTAVMGNVELAARALRELAVGQNLPAECRELGRWLHDAGEASERIRRAVLDLSVFARADGGKREVVDVERVMESTLRLIAPRVRCRARLASRYESELFVEATEAQLGQVFLNVVTNAVDAIPEGRQEENEIRISTFRDGMGHAIIEVADTGTGIDGDVQAQLFRPFFSTKPIGAGAGLGLALSRRVLANLGGRIDLQSRLGEGTKVRISLPAVPGVMERRSVPSPRVAQDARRDRVLVIDDDAQVGSSVARILSLEHDVVTTTRAREALARLVAGEPYDLVLCDVMMPEMTGMEFFAALTESVPTAAARVVFMTGGVFTPDARAFLDAVPNWRLRKPFTAEDLLELVRGRLLDPGAPRDAP